MTDKLLAPDLVVAVFGAGTMGRGIAQVCAQAGIRTLLSDTRDGAVKEAIAAVDKALDGQVAKGRMTAAAKRDTVANLVEIKSYDEAAKAGLVIEAIVELAEPKRALFREMEKRVAADAVLATNTSSLSVTEIAAGCERPGRVAGLHFFNPPPLMRLVEVIGGLRTDPNLVDRLTQFVRRIGKHPVVATDTPGFVVNHAGRAYGPEALRIVSQGIASPARGRRADEGGGRLPHGAVRVARPRRRRCHSRRDGQYLQSVFRRADVPAVGANDGARRRRAARAQEQAGVLRLWRRAGGEPADARGAGDDEAGRRLGRRRRGRHRPRAMARQGRRQGHARRHASGGRALLRHAARRGRHRRRGAARPRPDAYGGGRHARPLCRPPDGHEDSADVRGDARRGGGSACRTASR